MSREVLIATWGALFIVANTGLTGAGWAERRIAILIPLAYAGRTGWPLPTVKFLLITPTRSPVRVYASGRLGGFEERGR